MTDQPTTLSPSPQELFLERIRRVDDAIALKEGDRVPFAPFNSALPYFLYGASFRDSMYDYEKHLRQFSASTRISSPTQISTWPLPAAEPMNWPAPP